jgi:hypothetical protein
VDHTCNSSHNNHSDPILEEDLGQADSPSQSIFFYTHWPRGGKELEADMRRMGCLGLLEKSWRVQREEMVRELVTKERNHVYASTIRVRPDRWNGKIWSRVYRF